MRQDNYDFKPGDRVRVVKKYNYSDIDVGREGIVIRLSGRLCLIKCDETNLFEGHEFILRKTEIERIEGSFNDNIKNMLSRVYGTCNEKT